MITKRSWNESKFIEHLTNQEESYTLIELNIKEKYIIYKHDSCGSILKKDLELFKKRIGCNNKQCIINKRNSVVLEKYGTKNAFQSEEIKQKIKQNNIKKYGVENPMQVQEIKDKCFNTQIENYGAIGLASTEIMRKHKDSLIEKYGIDNVMKIPEVKAKLRNSLLKKNKEVFLDKIIGIKPLFSDEEYSGIWNTHKWECLKCGNVFEEKIVQWRLPRCLKCYPIQNNSQIEMEINIWLKEYFNNLETNIKYENKFELDIFIPEKNIGIEVDGIYWHSELSGNKDKNYHLAKTNFFKNKGIDIIHIYDIEWINKNSIIKSILKNRLGIQTNKVYARDCEFKIVSSANTKIFLENNHIQGYCNSSINLGLYLKDELVQIATFGKSRYNKKYEYELLRLCSKIDYSIIGGFSKLINKFKNMYSSSLISYIDKRFFNGAGYEKIGFLKTGESKPNYYYTKKHNVIESRIMYQKHKLKDRLKYFDKNLSEWENMKLNGFDRIWDCGNYIYELGKETK